MSSALDSKGYHHKTSGPAAKTASEHQGPSDLTLFSSCFCPFVQRVWIALEFFQIPYQELDIEREILDEVDPYVKPKDLLEVSPKSLVPALKLNAYNPPRALNESTVILEYVEDLGSIKGDKSLLPPKEQAYARGLIRLQCDHISRNIVPAFYRYLQAQETEAQITLGKAYLHSLQTLFAFFERAENENEPGALGLWKEGNELNLVDALVAPWLFRSTNTLKYYRGFELPTEGKTGAYLKRLFEYEAVKKTCSDEALYIDSYERYASNRPGTSQVADAINKGEALP